MKHQNHPRIQLRRMSIKQDLTLAFPSSKLFVEIPGSLRERDFSIWESIFLSKRRPQQSQTTQPTIVKKNIVPPIASAAIWPFERWCQSDDEEDEVTTYVAPPNLPLPMAYIDLRRGDRLSCLGQ